ncbi:GNAT family N-acetyltransferase [Nonomuraea sp. NBC_01738]|uniref:GNAT family N-acetyltransferase n=1 Tax=Nonomuraea sp. NBC_01738 TaxID=2976003 RepID=UPI002E0F4823|nr:GNAT family N-acetyltransferase [Nonomuraea sp. NBC_01738]
MTLDQLPLCLQLEDDRGWGTDQAKWRLMFEVGEVYGLAADDGDGLAGCVVRTPYGSGPAGVGMMLVATRYGRQGLGGVLMRHALDLSRGRVVELAATRFGFPLYERLGFAATGDLVVHQGSLDGGGAMAPGVRVAEDDDHKAIFELDAEVTGADRGDALRAVLARAERVVVADGGFAIAWDAGSHRVIGPVVASGEEQARALIAGAAVGADRDLRVDVRGDFPGVRAWLAGNGLDAGDPLPTMVHGGAGHPGDRSRYVAPILISMG